VKNRKMTKKYGDGNVSCRGLERKSGIPEGTIRDRIKGKVEGVGHMSGLKGRPRVLSISKCTICLYSN